MATILRAEGLRAGYGNLPVLRGIGLEVQEGEVVSLVGANGAGKTTLLRTLSGTLHPEAGTIEFDGQDITRLRAERIPAAGLALVPEGRHLFPYLTVAENLRLGAFHPRARYRETLEEVHELYPRLRGRSDQLAGSLSGGEQQMCAIARGMMALPKMMMLDEPSLGLAPIVVEQLFELIATLAQRGTTILLVEQNVAEALRLSDRAYVIERGEIVLSGSAAGLLDDEAVRSAYLGAG
jgi:branched-chain amino acid transport system ATP-binding protein